MFIFSHTVLASYNLGQERDSPVDIILIQSQATIR